MYRLTAFALAMFAWASAAFASSTVGVLLDGRAERIAATLSMLTILARHVTRNLGVKALTALRT